MPSSGTPNADATTTDAAVLRAVPAGRPTGDPDPSAGAARARDRAAIEALVADHGGRMHEAQGGPVVAGFTDPTRAVRCAVAVQQRLTPIEAAGPAWRLAVGLADDALAPLIAAADPGDVRISVALHRRVRDRLGLGFAPLEAPSEGFRVLADPATGPRRIWLYRAGALHNAALVLVLVLLLAAIAVPLWHLVIAPGGP